MSTRELSGEPGQAPQRYDFAVKSGDRDCIRELRTPRDLRIFTGEYQEPAPRECVVDGKVGHGIHIEWHRVQRDYKGILITPFQEALSHLVLSDPRAP